LFEAGDVVVANYPGVEGFKRRPAIVLSSEEYHRTRPDVILGLVTSQVAAAVAPSDCFLQDWRSAGLRKASAFRAFMITVPRDYVIFRAGRLSDNDWRHVRQRLQAALEM
jgi:mRNA interferase MazF